MSVTISEASKMLCAIQLERIKIIADSNDITKRQKDLYEQFLCDMRWLSDRHFENLQKLSTLTDTENTILSNMNES